MNTTRSRVALLSQHFAEYTFSLAQALAEDNEVLLVLDKENAKNELGKDWEEQLFRPSLQLVLLPRARNLAMAWSNFHLVNKMLGKFRPETIHCQDGGVRDELVMLLLAWRASPLILTVHDPVPHLGDNKALRFSRLVIYSMLVRRLCNAAIVHGEPLVEMLAGANDNMRHKTFVVPHGVLGQQCSQHDTAWTKGNMLFFGRMQEYKGLGQFITAIKQLAKGGATVRAIIAGRGPDLDRYWDDIVDSPLFDVRNRYIPPDEVAQLFRDANAVVLPYIEGTQSGVAALALGYGRPIVATCVGAIPELVRDQVNGLLVKPGAINELSVAMKSVITDQHLARVMAKNSWDLGRGALSWREIAATTMSVYQYAKATKLTKTQSPHFAEPLDLEGK